MTGMPGSDRIRHRTMAEYALEDLREAIILGDLPPGTPLRLDELAHSLGMSVSPIREAVRQLEALGLAEYAPHYGAKVVPFDIEDLRDLFQVRLALEQMALRSAAERFDDATAERAAARLEDLDAACVQSDMRRALRAHTDFHLTLYGASGSNWLLRAIRPMWDSSERFRPALFSSDGELQETHRDLDERLLAACREHDGEAAGSVLYEHLGLASRFFAPELGGRDIFE